MFSSIIAAIAGWSLLRDFQNKVEGLPYSIQGPSGSPDFPIFISDYCLCFALQASAKPNSFQSRYGQCCASPPGLRTGRSLCLKHSSPDCTLIAPPNPSALSFLQEAFADPRVSGLVVLGCDPTALGTSCACIFNDLLLVSLAP